MNDLGVIHDEQTGEIDEPIRTVPMLQGQSLAKAMHGIVSQLPVWIKQDEVAEVEYKTGAKRKTKYASLKAVMQVVRPIALSHGVRIRQGTEHAWQLDSAKGKGRMIPVYTDFIHSESGQTERTVTEIPLFNMDAQSMGSAISYGRRYGILAALGLTTDEADDDGAATKQKQIADTIVEESQELWAIKAEIRECSTLKELTEWGRKADESGRIEKLREDERPIAYLFNSDRIRALRYAHETEGKKAK